MSPTPTKNLPQVLIYQLPKNAMQSGDFKTGNWYMKFINYKELESKYIFDLMNWVGSKDTLSTINIPFNTKQEAIAFAKNKGFSFKISETGGRTIKPKSYASNFT